jgi:hypothetical protein
MQTNDAAAEPVIFRAARRAPAQQHVATAIGLQRGGAGPDRQAAGNPDMGQQRQAAAPPVTVSQAIAVTPSEQVWSGSDARGE